MTLGVAGAGWFVDPVGRHDQRWWDGDSWTPHVLDAGVAGEDELAPTAGATTASTAAGSDPSGQPVQPVQPVESVQPGHPVLDAGDAPATWPSSPVGAATVEDDADAGDPPSLAKAWGSLIGGIVALGAVATIWWAATSGADCELSGLAYECVSRSGSYRVETSVNLLVVGFVALLGVRAVLGGLAGIAAATTATRTPDQPD